MPRFAFWHAPTESIHWTFDRHPRLDEEIVLGDRGVFRVLQPRTRQEIEPDVMPYECARVRAASSGELHAMLKRGVNQLP